MTRYRVLVGIVVSLAIGYAGFLSYRTSRTNQPVDIARDYLRATYARNFAEAYDHLASADRQVRDRQSFVRSQGAYDGFTLQVAQKLAGFMTVWAIDERASDGRRSVKIGYRVPAPAELKDLLLGWDQERLNGLAPERQNQILAELDKRQQAGGLLTVEGQETVELIKEAQDWKVFLNWAAGTRVSLHSKFSESGKLTVRFANTEVMAKSDELFLINVKIKNPSPRNVTFTVSHLIEPQAAADDLQLVECGLLTPTTLAPQQEKEFAMAYLLGANAGGHRREFELTYEFKIK